MLLGAQILSSPHSPTPVPPQNYGSVSGTLGTGATESSRLISACITFCRCCRVSDSPLGFSNAAQPSHPTGKPLSHPISTLEHPYLFLSQVCFFPCHLKLLLKAPFPNPYLLCPNFTRVMGCNYFQGYCFKARPSESRP